MQYATGKTKPILNPEAKQLLGKHCGMVAKVHRSIIDNKDFVEVQRIVDANSETKELATFAETRWDGEFDLMETNCKVKQALTVLYGWVAIVFSISTPSMHACICLALPTHNGGTTTSSLQVVNLRQANSKSSADPIVAAGTMGACLCGYKWRRLAHRAPLAH